MRGLKKDSKATQSAWIDLKIRIHKSLVEEMDMSDGSDKDPKAQVILKEKTRKLVDLLGKEDTKGVINSRDDMQRFVKEILDEALGLGPLEDLLAEKGVSEIMVVGQLKSFTKKAAKLKNPILFLRLIDKRLMLSKELWLRLVDGLMKRLTLMHD